MYHFEVLQELQFSVYDIDSKNPSLDAHDLLGNCQTTLGQVSRMVNSMSVSSVSINLSLLLLSFNSLFHRELSLYR